VSERILQGDVFARLPEIAPGSVDCCVTSPPYWMLRSYLPKDHPLKHLELGSEPTPQQYVAKMVKVFSLVREVLAGHATCWVNVGDSYSHDSRGGETGGKHFDWHGDKTPSATRYQKTTSVPARNLCLIPQRLAIALQEYGWIVRSVVVWHKPAPMPISVSGWVWRRCRVKVANGNQNGSGKQATNRLSAGLNERTAEYAAAAYPGAPQSKLVGHSGNHCPAAAQWQDCPGCDKCTPHGGYVLHKGSWRPTSSWEPILMMAKSDHYFCDQQAVLTSAAAATVKRDRYSRILDDPDEQFAVRHDHETMCAGANPRDVQTWAAEPLKEAHYAAFPTKLVDFCLRASTSSKGYCPHCGAPWCRVVDRRFVPQPDVSREKGRRGHDEQKPMDESNDWKGMPRGSTESATLGWRPTCQCPPHKPRSGVVLDPFCGSGRTALAARRLGLDFVGVELNPAYVAMSQAILYADSPLFSDPGDPA
jgi:DNA modification methylase